MTTTQTLSRRALLLPSLPPSSSTFSQRRSRAPLSPLRGRQVLGFGAAIVIFRRYALDEEAVRRAVAAAAAAQQQRLRRAGGGGGDDGNDGADGGDDKRGGVVALRASKGASRPMGRSSVLL